MAVANTKSAEIQNIEASPIVANDSRHSHGRVRIKSATLAVAAADDDLSVYRFFRVKKTDSIKSLQLYCDGITGATDYDVGLYPTLGNGAAVVDLDLYADGLNLEVATPTVPHVLASAGYLECSFGDTATSAIQDINNVVWEDLGLALDTAKAEYDVCIHAATVGSGAGDMTLIMYYTAGD